MPAHRADEEALKDGRVADAFTLETRGPVAHLKVSRPPVNALRFRDWVDFRQLIGQLSDQDTTRVLVLSGGTGRHFCAGNDFNEFAELSPRQTDDGTAAVLSGVRSLYESRLVSVAAIHGAAVGSGLLLASACDIRLATADSHFGLPEILAGAFGGYRLAREILPKGEARLTAFTGQPIDGNRAHVLGVVQRLHHDSGAVQTAGLELAEEIASNLTDELSCRAKELVNRIEDASMRDGHDLERLLEIRIMGKVQA